MQQKYELGTGLSYFWHKNEKKISLNLIFCIPAPTFWTLMSLLFIIKICFTNKINTICDGGQLLVSGSQYPISRVTSVRLPCPRTQGSEGPSRSVSVLGSQSPRSQDPRSHILGLKIPVIIIIIIIIIMNNFIQGHWFS